MSIMKVNGRMDKDPELEDNIGQMALYMKDNLLKIWQMVKEDSYIQMVIYIQENG